MEARVADNYGWIVTLQLFAYPVDYHLGGSPLWCVRDGVACRDDTFGRLADTTSHVREPPDRDRVPDGVQQRIQLRHRCDGSRPPFLASRLLERGGAGTSVSQGDYGAAEFHPNGKVFRVFDQRAVGEHYSSPSWGPISFGAY